MRATWWRFSLVAGLALATVPGMGRAAGWPGADGSSLLTPLGEYVLAGGGVTDFVDGDTRDRFDVGGTWDLRLGIGNRFYVGGELAYVGTTRSGGGLDLMGNGGEAVLRVQYPYAAGRWLVEPFAFGGIGWSHLSLDGAPAGVKDTDEIGVVPFGAGVGLGYGRLLLDARFTYRAAFDEDLAGTATARPADLDQWGVTASVGYAF